MNQKLSTIVYEWMFTNTGNDHRFIQPVHSWMMRIPQPFLPLQYEKFSKDIMKEKGIIFFLVDVTIVERQDILLKNQSRKNSLNLQ